MRPGVREIGGSGDRKIGRSGDRKIGRSAGRQIANSRLIRVLTIAVALLIAGGSDVYACPMCFGAEETSMINGTRLGILVMLGITIAVQGAFVAFFIYLRKRAKRAAEIDLDNEWSELQRASR